MEAIKNQNELHVYSINENEYFGAINASIDGWSTCLVVVLDTSEPMKDEAARFVKDILPLVMPKVKYWGSFVEFITFGEESVHKEMCKSTDLSDLQFKSGGAAKMGPAIEKLRTFLESKTKGSVNSFDILTISAGEISDHENAANESTKLTDYLAQTVWRINSHAVRLITKSNNHQPDVKALSYLLQINNTTAANICDINVTASNEAIADQLIALFTEDFGRFTNINFGQSIVLKFPWKSLLFDQIKVFNGWNTFWMKKMPTKAVAKSYDAKKKIFDDINFNIVVAGQFNLGTFQKFTEKQVLRIVSHMKILKIVNSAEANETVDEIFSYFAAIEDSLALKGSSPNNRIITNALAGIAHYKADFRDSAEMIEFFRDPTKAIEEQQKLEAQEKLKRDEEERVKRIQEEHLRQKAEKEEVRLRQEAEKEEERFRQEAEKEKERLKQEAEKETERLKQEAEKEEERLRQETEKEEERVREEGEQRSKQKRWESSNKEECLERVERVQREIEGKPPTQEEEEQLRHDGEKEDEIRNQEVKERTFRVENGYGKQQEEVPRKSEENARIKRTEEITYSRTGPNGAPSSIQSVFIFDERTCGANERRRFTEKCVPLMLSKLFSDSQQLVHRVTFVRYKTYAAEMLQSLVQTLDATNQIRISILTNGGVHLRKEIEDLAENVAQFLGESGYLFELQVVRLASISPSTKRIKFLDFDSTESSEFVAKQRNVHDYVAGAAGIGSYCSLYSIVFFMIFALLILRYIYLFF